MIVIDASALVDALTDEGPLGERLLARLRHEDRWAVPELVDLEFASYVRRDLFARSIEVPDAEDALVRLAEAPLNRFPHVPLLAKIWSLRNNVTAYDGAYVALAQLLGVPLLTTDVRLARAVDGVCEVETI